MPSLSILEERSAGIRMQRIPAHGWPSDESCTHWPSESNHHGFGGCLHKGTGWSSACRRLCPLSWIDTKSGLFIRPDPVIFKIQRNAYIMFFDQFEKALPADADPFRCFGSIIPEFCQRLVEKSLFKLCLGMEIVILYRRIPFFPGIYARGEVFLLNKFSASA